MRRLLATACLLAAAAPALGQGNDEGVAPTREGPDAESRQFEAEAPRRAAANLVPLRDSQLQSLNNEARTLEAQLNGGFDADDIYEPGINETLREIDRLLQEQAQGRYLLRNTAMPGLCSRRGCSDHPDFNTYITLSGPELAAYIDNLYPHLSAADKAAFYRQWVAWSSDHQRNLSQLRFDYLQRRDQNMRRLEQIRRIVMADADRPGQAYDPYASETASCVLPHSWRNDVQGLGSSTWTVDEDGEAHESGMGSTRGMASFSGNSLVIQWDGGTYAGNYTVQLGKDCNGRGTLNWTRSPNGPQSFPATFTSVGGNRY